MRGIGAFAALLLAGCSFGFVAGPPPQAAQLPSVLCTDSNLAPILDSVLGGLAATISLGAASATDEKWAMDQSDTSFGARSDAIVVYGALAALEAASAYYGYRTVHTCREARQLADDRVQHALQVLPATWPPPPGAALPGATPPTAPAAPSPGPAPPLDPGAPGAPSPPRPPAPPAQ
jgi:hypothetical protein